MAGGGAELRLATRNTQMLGNRSLQGPADLQEALGGDTRARGRDHHGRTIGRKLQE